MMGEKEMQVVYELYNINAGGTVLFNSIPIGRASINDEWYLIFRFDERQIFKHLCGSRKVHVAAQ